MSQYKYGSIAELKQSLGSHTSQVTLTESTSTFLKSLEDFENKHYGFTFNPSESVIDLISQIRDTGDLLVAHYPLDSELNNIWQERKRRFDENGNMKNPDPVPSVDSYQRDVEEDQPGEERR